MKFRFGEVIQKFFAIKNLVLFLIKINSDLFRLSKWLGKLKILKPNIYNLKPDTWNLKSKT